ncbi:hypothetical protein ORG27_14785 [Stenotrophomonas lactitubi]|uniref:hypothetical protein n=1 Tax=Stenotrophomonas lactitubi TaxID=2045214 RepID=UPI002249684C|nr:hypothetical protein [Stenotrophomonas lactitubi]MCX2894843.1 hypothetical protein [Stenotrophomonas lactitubi]
MNKDNAKDYLPLVQALADGKVIQIEIDGVWTDGNEFHFVDQPSEYRIKPEPREIWVNEYAEGDHHMHYSAESAEHARGICAAVTRRYREVIE